MTNLDLTELSKQVVEVSETVWGTITGVSLSPINSTLPLDDAGHVLAGCIRIGGEWNGAVVMYCTQNLAKLAAHAMLGVETEKASKDDLRDAFGELINMTGGNIKSLLPGPSTLSLPVVADGNELTLRIPKSKTLLTVCFETNGERLNVTLMEGGHDGHPSR